MDLSIFVLTFVLIVVAVISFIAGLMVQTKSNSASYIDLDKDSIHRQRMEDQRMEREIEKRAYSEFQKWVDAPYITLGDGTFKNYIPILTPMSIYRVYHKETAKYVDVDRAKEVEKLYKDLIHHYQQNHTTPNVFDRARKAYEQGDKFLAVKFLKEETEWTLKECKDYADRNFTVKDQ